MAFVKGYLCAKLVLRYVGKPMVLKPPFVIGEVSLDDLQEKLIGEVSLLNALLEYPGDVSRNDLLDNLVDENAEEYSSVGEKVGIKDLGNLGVDVKDLDGI